MRKTAFLAFIILLALSATAQPLLVGHRGSYWGVENTAEAFINGAKKGYQYLECDVKVAGDGTLVLSHDDDTSRLGGSLTIASSTIDQLKAETYTQTRGGVAYTANICTLAEYLDICAEYSVLPVIELKWATGINSNDCSGIPALIKAIEGKGFRNKCVILTSMKPCLEYIRKNYPDITLQFLTGQYWSNHFDWCVEQGIDVDIQAGYFDKATVTKFHDAGLKVNMWTANDDAAYRTYGNYGCDFITTDYLDPAALPTLDASVLFPPNTIDYPNATGTIQGRYEPETVSLIEPGLIPESVSATRALLRKGKWYVLYSKFSGDAHQLCVYDAESGEMLQDMSINDAAGEAINIRDIAFTADGVLLGCNMATVPLETWKIYKWASDDATPELFAEISTADKLGNWENTTAGLSMAVSGHLKDLRLYALTYSPAAATRSYRIAGIQFTNGVASAFAYSSDDSQYTQDAWGIKPTLTVTPSSRDNILIDSNSMSPREYTFDWEGDGAPMAEYATIPEGTISDAATGISFLRYASKVYAYAADISGNTISATMYDVTDSIKNMTAVSSLTPDRLTLPETWAYYNTAIELTDGCIYLYMYIDDRGFLKYKASSEAGTAEPSPDAEFALELVWQNSINTGNAPEHIDGTNAQQGGAANGLFYVNDCVDKKIYLFDQTGCLGSINGGAGWGCALDDAGNIIVRNDKETGTSHSFIIYPSGATVSNPGQPVSLEVDVPLSGQTNFISASGDVLGKGGYIYMYPNKQSAINIISVADGKVTAVTASHEISLTGTTAGYVIPVNNNTENWIYQVRNSGYYTYNGGENEILLAGRGTTTAPARNNTVGGEYVVLSGHRIFIHNSGANYTGGFTVRNLSTDETISSVDPIGNLGYVTGGNYSVANWIFAEKTTDSSCILYQYCPANGMAVYNLYDKNASGIDDLEAGEQYRSAAVVFPNPASAETTVTCGEQITRLEVHSLNGAAVHVPVTGISTNRATINVGHLPSGIYLLRVNNSEVIKLVKK